MNIRRIGAQALEINGRRVEFEQEINEFVGSDEKVIILFEPSKSRESDPDFGRNIVALDGSGQQLWRIQDSGFTFPSHRNRNIEVPAPYTGLGVEEDGRITVF